MKRSWFGFGLLVVLLILSLLAGWAMGEIHRPVTRDLELAAEAALREDWPKAQALAETAWKAWDDWQGLRKCLCDHTPIEEVESGLCQLEVYGKSRETGEFAALCRELARKTTAIGDAHSLSLWNLM